MDSLLEQLRQQQSQRGSLPALEEDDDMAAYTQQLHASQSIRASVRDQVDDVLWLDHLREEEAQYKQRVQANRAVSERCLVCTLPWGSCQHTAQWVNERQTQREDQEFREKNDLDQQISDVLNVLDETVGSVEVSTSAVEGDIDVQNMQWSLLQQRASDKIGSTALSLFAPDERGWHSTTKLCPQRILTFGGFRYRKKEVPQPFKGVPLPQEVEYLNDLRLYDADNSCWRGVKARGRLPSQHDATTAATATATVTEKGGEPPCPEGRYGHVAAALDRQRLLVFSGRAVRGRVLNDTWVYHCNCDAWQLVQTNQALNLPLPPPRYFSSACSLFPDDSNLLNLKHNSNNNNNSSGGGGVIRDVLGMGHSQQQSHSYSISSALSAEELLLIGYNQRPRSNTPRRSNARHENIGSLDIDAATDDNNDINNNINNNINNSCSSNNNSNNNNNNSSNNNNNNNNSSNNNYSNSDNDNDGAGPSADVYLFGGTDGVDNFGDLWVFRGHPKVMKWERVVAVGPPPSPRYGHQLVAITGCHSDSNSSSSSSSSSSAHYSTRMNGAAVAGGGQQLAVVGGCSVSPQGEVVGTSLGVAETKALIASSSEVRRSYRSEERFAAAAGAALETSAMLSQQQQQQQQWMSGGGGSMDGVYKQAADATAALHRMEQRTRIAEREMADKFKISAGNAHYNIRQARHPNPLLDVMFLNTTEMIWRVQVHPPIRGNVPVSRVHFGCCCIGSFLFVTGGAEPTALHYKHVEAANAINNAAVRAAGAVAVGAGASGDSSSNGSNDISSNSNSSSSTLMYVLDLRSMLWQQPTAVNSAEHLREQCSIADADVIRAYSRCDQEKSRALSLGALGGLTVELCEAEAVLEVCKWRRAVLSQQQQQQQQFRAPAARFGASLLSLRQRLLYIGGWEQQRAAQQGQSFVCNVEHVHERRRRLDDEVNARLERDRISAQAEARMKNVQSVFELRAQQHAESVQQQQEQRRMRFEELLSSLPPLSQPDAVQLQHANAHCIWVQWQRLHRNSSRQSIDAKSVTYFLYMRCGFQNLQCGDRVFVTARPDKKKLAAAAAAAARQQQLTVAGKFGSFGSSLQQQQQQQQQLPSDTDNFDSEVAIFDDECKRFPGEITKRTYSSGCCFFDVLYDDGTIEKLVPRRRLKLAPAIRYSSVPLDALRPNTTTATTAAATVDSSSNNNGNNRPTTSESHDSTISSYSRSNINTTNSNHHQQQEQRVGDSNSAAVSAVAVASVADVVSALQQQRATAATATRTTSRGAGSSSSSGGNNINITTLVPYSRRSENEFDRSNNNNNNSSNNNSNNSRSEAALQQLPTAVVPLEFAGTVRSRMKQRVLRSQRAAARCEQLRGVTAEMQLLRNAPKKQKLRNAAAAAEMQRRLNRQQREEKPEAARIRRRHGHDNISSSANDAAVTSINQQQQQLQQQQCVVMVGETDESDFGIPLLHLHSPMTAATDAAATAELSPIDRFSRGSSFHSVDSSNNNSNNNNNSSNNNSNNNSNGNNNNNSYRGNSRETQRSRGNVRFSGGRGDNSSAENDFNNQKQQQHQQQRQQQQEWELMPPSLWGDESAYGDPFSTSHPPLTVLPDERWRLVYAGNECSYSCCNLVPLDALLLEPQLRVPVAFCLQTHGVDKPLYERSQLSNPAIFFTQPVPLTQQQQQQQKQQQQQLQLYSTGSGRDDRDDLSPAAAADSFDDGDAIAATDAVLVPRLPQLNDPQQQQQLSDQQQQQQQQQLHQEQQQQQRRANPINVIPRGDSISKTKKQIIAAVLGSAVQQRIEIEKLSDTCVSYGLGEDFI